MSNPSFFGKRQTVEQVEEGEVLAPRFDADGLLPCVTTSAASGEVLMLGYMNEEALRLTIQTGEAHYWSRSRKKLWHKGRDSGLVQYVRELRVDDDQDAVWIRVDVQGVEESGGKEASCHVGYRSCFYRCAPVGAALSEAPRLTFTETKKTFDPTRVYGDVPNPTQL
ncbi:MAG: phosphoribosyl-AMP cyclohydrolase [Rickettsiales bacterium]